MLYDVHNFLGLRHLVGGMRNAVHDLEIRTTIDYSRAVGMLEKQDYAKLFADKELFVGIFFRTLGEVGKKNDLRVECNENQITIIGKSHCIT